MHRARQHAETRIRERRSRLATEAARLMAEGGIRDFHQAKLKAAQRLGIRDDASLPRNREIEDALRQYQRLFLGEEEVKSETLGAVLDARTQGKKDTTIFFQADKGVDYGDLMSVMDALRAAGYLKVGLVGLETAAKK